MASEAVNSVVAVITAVSGLVAAAAGLLEAIRRFRRSDSTKSRGELDLDAKSGSPPPA